MTEAELQSLLVRETFLAVLPKATQKSLILARHCTAPALGPASHGHSCSSTVAKEWARLPALQGRLESH